MKKEIWRLEPCLYNGGKRGWTVTRVTFHGTTQTRMPYSTHSSLKAAKTAVAHLRKKPIDLPL